MFALLAHAPAIVAPNTSLATTPTGYFGGNVTYADQNPDWKGMGRE